MGAGFRRTLCHSVLPSPALRGHRVRGPGPRHPGRPARARAPTLPHGAGAEVGSSAPLPSPPPLSRFFQSPLLPRAARGPPTEPTQAPQGAGGCHGQKRVPVAYLGPQRRERRAGAAALSPPWAPRGAGADDPCPRGVGFSLALGLSGLGASRTLPFQAPPAPLRADVTAPPQPMAVGNLSRAARPPRFKSESPRPRELRGGRFGPGGHPGPGPVGPRGAPAWLRSGPDPPPPTPNLGPRGQGRDSPRGPSTRPSRSSSPF